LIAPSFVYLVIFFHADVVVAYFQRFFLPVFVLLLPLYVGGIYKMVMLWGKSFSLIPQKILAGFIAAYLGVFYLPVFSGLNFYSSFAQIGLKSELHRMQVVKWINTNIKQGDEISMGECGMIPYLADKHIIDTYCLNSREMTQAPINLSYQRYSKWLINQRKPKYVMLMTKIYRGVSYYPPFDLLAIRHQNFNRCYRPIRKFSLGDYHEGDVYQIYQRQC
jgi:hypothetical protein